MGGVKLKKKKKVVVLLVLKRWREMELGRWVVVIGVGPTASGNARGR